MACFNCQHVNCPTCNPKASRHTNLRIIQTRGTLAQWQQFIDESADIDRRYRLRCRRLTEAYRQAIYKADPRVGLEMAFHLAHNWGNSQAQAMLVRLQSATQRLRDRYESADARHEAAWAKAVA